MEWYIYLLIVVAGFIAGFINTLAGAGSLLILPLLIFLGLPATIANGTNRIGVLLQSIVATRSFKQKKLFVWPEAIEYLIPASVGAVLGASLAVTLNEHLMQRVIGGLLIFMFFVVLYKPERWINDAKSLMLTPMLRILRGGAFFLVGLYGGFIQAGVGYFLLASFVFLTGSNLLKSNALMVLLTMVFTAFALVVFMLNREVDYFIGLLLGVGSMSGAWFAAKIAIKRGAPFVRYFLLATLFVFSVKLLFF